MKRFVKFIAAVVRHWGSLLTGGVIIATLQAAEWLGLPVPRWTYLVVIGFALLSAFFLSWSEQVTRVEQAEKRNLELEGRPEVMLTCSSIGEVEFFGQIRRRPGSEPKGRFVFSARNSGTVQAVNVSMDDIKLPMSELTQRNRLAEDQAFITQTGEDAPARQPGWNVWTVRFEPLTSVAQGQEIEIVDSDEENYLFRADDDQIIAEGRCRKHCRVDDRHASRGMIDTRATSFRFLVFGGRC